MSSETIAALYPWVSLVGLAAAAKLSLRPKGMFHLEPTVESARATPLVLVLASGALVAAAWDGVGRPLGWDELRAALQIPAEPLWRVLSVDPRIQAFHPSPNHGVGNLASWVAVKALGRSIEAYQVSGIAFTALAALVLFWLGRRRLSGFAICLVVGHLLANLVARWHFVSLRGAPVAGPHSGSPRGTHHPARVLRSARSA